jgi:ribosomal protein S18 acetylase RimI-like enzyme
MIWKGNRSGAEIFDIRTEEDLSIAWQQLDYYSPAGTSAWIEQVEIGNNSIYVARLGAVAIGMVTVKWTGPSMREPEFTAALEEEFPGQGPIATIYGLDVLEYYRRRGIAGDLMDVAEQQVFERPNLARRTALGVEITNTAAKILYINRGYQILPYKGQESVVMDTPANADREEKIPANLMSKDLSSLR